MFSQQGKGIARVFDTGIADFEEQAFLGVHPFGFARRDVKKRGVETLNILKKAAPFRVHCHSLRVL